MSVWHCICITIRQRAKRAKHKSANSRESENIMTTRHVESKSRNSKNQLRLKTAGSDRKKRNALNHIIDSQAAKIDSCLHAGRFTIEEIKAFAGARTTARVKNHFKHLQDSHDLFVMTDAAGKCKFVV